MGCKLTSGTGRCAPMSAPGIVRMLMTSKSNAQRFTYTDDTLSEVRYVLTQGGNPAIFNEMIAENTYCKFEEQVRIDERGTFYVQTIDMRWPMMDSAKREVAAQLVRDRIVAIFQDSNGLWWIAGQENGLQTIEERTTTDAAGGANGYTIRLSGLERWKARNVDAGVATYDNPNNGQSTSRITNLGGAGPNGGITAIMDTWGMQSVGGPWMPLGMLGNLPINQVIQ